MLGTNGGGFFNANNLTAIGTGDNNGDGKGDILFTNAAAQAVIWTMDGTNVSVQREGGAGNMARTTVLAAFAPNANFHLLASTGGG